MRLTNKTPMLNRLKRYLELVKNERTSIQQSKAHFFNLCSDILEKMSDNLSADTHHSDKDLSSYKKNLESIFDQYHDALLIEHFKKIKPQLKMHSVFVPIILLQDTENHINSDVECFFSEGKLSIRVPVGYQYDTAILIGKILKVIQLKNIICYSIYSDTEHEQHPAQLGEDIILDGFNTLNHHIHELDEQSIIYIPRSLEYIQNSFCEVVLIDLSIAYESQH